MNPGRDDARPDGVDSDGVYSDGALSWDGDDDPTLDVGTTSDASDTLTAPDASTAAVDSSMIPPAASDSASMDAAPRALPDGYTAVGKGSADVGRIADDGTVVMPGERQPMGNATLIGLGVLGGIYLLYAIGWLIGAGRLSLIAQLFLDPIAFQVTLWLAVLAPPIWFLTVFVFTRGGRAWIRFTLLAIGAVVLIPWPFVLAGAAL